MMHIDKETYKISNNNHYRNNTKKSQIVIGSSLRKDHYHIKRLQHKDYGKTKKWNTFTISRDGKIYQHYDDKYYSDFLGVKEGDKKSISIILENMGCLFETSSRKYINWLNEFCDINQVVEKEWFGYDFWEKYSDDQIDSLVDLINLLCDKHNIPKKIIEFHTYHKNTYKFKGIVFKGNYIEDSTDINPLLNTDQLIEMLSNDN
ncbi:MAG: N-acetylmuramoyl-L-alanine amidase [Bacteroidales bacterium]|jgi:N-acetyl-anhydromuramyl-L-alanine amidase AmpD|nr:N-acetylmuramoyl-L-alanine amidase [Bacteroidales bacterium]